LQNYLRLVKSETVRFLQARQDLARGCLASWWVVVHLLPRAESIHGIDLRAVKLRTDSTQVIDVGAYVKRSDIGEVTVTEVFDPTFGRIKMPPSRFPRKTAKNRHETWPISAVHDALRTLDPGIPGGGICHRR
jgi:hypothetical protein